MVGNKIWYEKLHMGCGQYFAVKNIIYQENTNFQNVIFFENPTFGRIMAIDGIVQTTENDEFIYHEMITHVPLLTMPSAKKILIIGGGDGASLREVIKYKYLEKITMVEIDENIINLCRKYLPNHNQNAYTDIRCEIIIQDGSKFISSCKEKFDIIIVDSTDPIGPGSSLFTPNFYRECRRCLNDDGIFVGQNGVSLLQQKVIKNSFDNLSCYFNDVTFYQAAVPSYYGGMMTFVWASNNTSLRQITVSVLNKKFKLNNLHCRYYNPLIHKISFALPQYLLNILTNTK
ncbi:MAG: polyamine aminopropyltransferase [Candidatus Dasytiphilus stammeri]